MLGQHENNNIVDKMITGIATKRVIYRNIQETKPYNLREIKGISKNANGM